MIITETNINRLVDALNGYHATTHTFSPIDDNEMLRAIDTVTAALLVRGTDIQSRVNRLFADDLPAIVQPLIDMARVLKPKDAAIADALLYLDGTIL